MTPERTGWPFRILPTKRANKKTFPEVAATKKKHLPQRQVLQTIWKEGPNHSSSHLSFPKFSGPYLVGKFREVNHRQKKSMYSFHSLILHKKGHAQFLDFKPGSPQTYPDESFPEPLPYQRVISLWQVQSFVPPLPGGSTGDGVWFGCSGVVGRLGGFVMGLDVCFSTFTQYRMGWLAHLPPKLLKSQILCLIQMVGHFHPEFL